MNRANVAEIRNSLLMADQLKRAGIAFIPVPYFAQEEKEKLAKQADEILERAISSAERENTNE